MVQVARWTTILALFLIAFLPLYVAGDLFFPFITGKNFLFRILVEIALVAWMVLTLFDKKYRPQRSWTLILFVGFAAWMFVADLFGVHPHKAFWSNYERMDGWVMLAHVTALFVVAGSVLSVEKLWRPWWLTFLGVAAVVCLYGLLQLTGVYKIHQSGVRVDASFGNAAYLAAYLLFVIPVSLWQAHIAKGWQKWGFYILTFLAVIILFNTATRGAIIGAVAAVFLCAVLGAFFLKKTGRRIAIGFLAGTLILLGAFFTLRESTLVTSNPVLSRFASISVSEGITRFTIWGIAWKGFLQDPFTGWGQEGFNQVFNTYYDPSLYAQEQWFDRAHNTYLDWLVAGGFPAFFLFLALLIWSIRALWKSEESRETKLILSGALIAYGVQALFVFDNLFSYVPLVMVLAYIHQGHSVPIRSLVNLRELSPASAIIVTPVAVVAGIVLMWSVNVPGMQAANDIIRGLSASANPTENLEHFKTALSRGSFASQEIREQLLSLSANFIQNPGVPNDIKLNAYQLAVSEMEQEITRVSGDARLYLQLAGLHRTAGNFDLSLSLIDEALRLSPLKESIITEKGVTLWQKKDYESARTAFFEAYELGPEFQNLAIYAAAGDILTRRFDEADAILVKHFATTTVDSDILIGAHYEIQRFEKILDILRLRVANAGGTPDTRFRLAEGYAALGRFEEARAEVQGIVKVFPGEAARAGEFLKRLP